VSGDDAQARKAIEIFDAWLETLADAFENDAMLLAGWTGGQFCSRILTTKEEEKDGWT
jgi:pyridoxine/pyridoxamine 5'-phosphate oxidase